MVRTERALLEGAGHAVGVHQVRNPTTVGDTVRTMARAPWNRPAAAEAVAAAERFEADVVHVHNTWFSLSPAVFRHLRRAGKPVVATIHNYRVACVNALFYRDGGPCEDCLGHVPWRGVMHACYRGSRLESAAVAASIQAGRIAQVWSRDVQVVVALTDFSAAKLVEAGIPPSRLAVKPNVVTDPGPRPHPPSAGNRLLFVGRISEEKGVQDLLAAWEDELPFDLVMIGEGPLLPAAEDQAEGRVHFRGAVDSDEVRRAMSSARALVVPSRWYEGLPMVVLEGMASGLPVVVPDHGGLPGAIGDGAITFQPGRVDALRDALGRLSSDTVVDQLGSSSRAAYEARYAPDVGLDALLAVYQRAVAGQE